MALLNSPEPGYYRRRMVRGGPLIPVRIYYSNPEIDGAGKLKEDETLLALVGLDTPANAFDLWTYVAGNPISEDEYNFLIAQLKHKQQHEPNDPLNTPQAPVDFGSMGTHGEGARARADQLMAEPAREIQTMEDAQASTLWIKRAIAVGKLLDGERQAAEAMAKEQLAAIGKPYKDRAAQLDRLIEDEKALLHGWRRTRNFPRVDTEYGARAFTRDVPRMSIVLNLVPKDFLMPDLEKIKAHLKAHPDQPIPGVTVINEPVTVVS